MKGKIRILTVLAVLCPLGSRAQGIEHIIEALSSIDCYTADARFTVMMPQMPDDVVYRLALSQSDSGGDRYSPCDYLIDWSVDTPSGPSEGFSAYYDGHHFRYRGQRLQEYHVEWDSVPFHPGGTVTSGVQQTAQFVNLLPAYIARDFRKWSADSAYTLEAAKVVSGGRDCWRVKVDMALKGMVTMKSVYLFDSATFSPLSAEIENNIGSLSEQTLSVVYTYPDAGAPCVQVSETLLVERYPDAFEKYRESNFKVENLPGTRLPEFSVRTTTGERFTHHSDDSFRAPTLIAVLDPSTGFNDAIVKALRDAVDSADQPADIIWAFTSNNVDEIESIIPQTRPGEHLLMSARTLARDCGVTACPVIILAAPDATVKDVIIGYNNSLGSDVIQKIALIK